MQKNIEDTVAVISCYEGQIDEFKNLFKEIYIYDKSESGEYKSTKCSDYNQIPNFGYNQFSYLQFIVENYYNLPQRIAFIKSNVVDRHISLNQLKDCLCIDDKLISLFYISEKDYANFPSHFDHSKKFLYELKTGWFESKFESNFIKSNEEFEYLVFGKALDSNYFYFSPGCNYIIDKNLLLMHPRSFYENLLQLVSFRSQPLESHFIERYFPALFDERNYANFNFYKKESIKIILEQQIGSYSKSFVKSILFRLNLKLIMLIDKYWK